MTTRAKGSHAKQFGQLTGLLTMASTVTRNGEQNVLSGSPKRGCSQWRVTLLAMASGWVARNGE
jgi:hypothetical protein